MPAASAYLRAGSSTSIIATAAAQSHEYGASLPVFAVHCQLTTSAAFRCDQAMSAFSRNQES